MVLKQCQGYAVGRYLCQGSLLALKLSWWLVCGAVLVPGGLTRGPEVLLARMHACGMAAALEFACGSAAVLRFTCGIGSFVAHFAMWLAGVIVGPLVGWPGGLVQSAHLCLASEESHGFSGGQLGRELRLQLVLRFSCRDMQCQRCSACRRGLESGTCSVQVGWHPSPGDQLVLGLAREVVGAMP